MSIPNFYSIIISHHSAKMKVLLINFITLVVLAWSRAENNQLPDNFLLGFATCAYQVEGAWNASGKGENIWDRYFHTHPELDIDHEHGDIAADQYHKYLEDVHLMKEVGVQIHRFSLSWTRILPDGLVHHINQDGIDYYNNFINALIANNIVPLVTIYHWDLPQRLQDIGGWVNPLMVDYFEDFARVAFSAFGDRVKYWLTINEPLEICSLGYGSTANPPALNDHGVADYLCGHTLLQAHARAYHLYNNTFRPTQNGLVGMVFSGDWVQPNSTSEDDKIAAETALAFQIGWFADPIFSKSGDYPAVMRENIDRNSASEGQIRSRLPLFDPETIEYIKGTCDFYGMNQYSTRLAVPAKEPVGEIPSWDRDSAVAYLVDPTWASSSATDWLYVVPWGIRKLLNYVKDKYSSPMIIITENGYSDGGELDDDDRIDYHYSYFKEILKAIHEDGVNVTAYTAWSLLDNPPSRKGFETRWGIIHVDIEDPGRARKLKKSARWFQQFLKTRSLPNTNFESA